ncbi:hypothetical protein FKW77_008787 [Venturia effusa]|uniref:Uncharacterized protein n=1 Tax=Venturia effusa TaxID=50376 RepID=A0A517LBI5_9PEZI|nr:hypothetical protein FKW77_008787 [Venturia effusa]
MSQKRSADHLDTHSPRRTKVSRTGVRLGLRKTFEPKKLYTKHPESRVGENFHSVSYPLALIPYSSWFVLHHGNGGKQDHQYTCSKCNKKRSRITPHERKLFLVAERLSWHGFRGIVPAAEKALNEQQLWAVNFELGITNPAVEDPESLMVGGKNSQSNPFYPYRSEEEMETALALLRHTDRLSEVSFKIWLSTLDSMSMAANKTDNGPPALKMISTSASNSVTRKASIANFEDEAQTPPAPPNPIPFEPCTTKEQQWLEFIRPLVAFSHATVQKRDRYHKESSIEEEAVRRLMEMARDDVQIQQIMDGLGRADREAIKTFGGMCTSVLNGIHDAWAPRSNRPWTGADPPTAGIAATGCVSYASRSQESGKGESKGVVEAIAARAAGDQKFCTLMRKVAAGKASKTESAEFQKVYREVKLETAAVVKSTSQPTTPAGRAAIKEASLQQTPSSRAAEAVWPFAEHMEDPTPEKIMAKYNIFLQAIPPPVVHRICVVASLDTHAEALLAKAGNNSANTEEMKAFDELVNRCHMYWTNDRHALELELALPKGWEVHGMRNFSDGRGKYRVLSAVQRGGVQSSIIHYMLARARDVKILGRLFYHISSGHSTQLQNGIFLDVINCFERFYFSNHVVRLQETMAHLEISIKDALISDITFRYIPVLPEPVWSQALADVAKTRAMIKQLYHLGPIAQLYGETGLCWVDPENIVNPQDVIDVQNAEIPAADFEQMYPPIASVATPTTEPKLTPAEQATAARCAAEIVQAADASSSGSETRLDTPKKEYAGALKAAPLPTPSSSHDNKTKTIEIWDDEKSDPSQGLLDFLSDKTLKPATSFRTLKEFYSLLDRIERTSYVGSRYLEVYAEFLHRESCNECWLRGMGVEIEEDDMHVKEKEALEEEDDEVDQAEEDCGIRFDKAF